MKPRFANDDDDMEEVVTEESFPFMTMFTNFENSVQMMLSTGSTLHKQAINDTRKVSNELNNMKKRYKELKERMISMETMYENKLEKFNVLVEDFKHEIRSKDDVISSLSKAIPKDHGAYIDLTQKIINSNRASRKLVQASTPDNSTLDDDLSYVERTPITSRFGIRRISPVVLTSHTKNKRRKMHLSTLKRRSLESSFVAANNEEKEDTITGEKKTTNDEIVTTSETSNNAANSKSPIQFNKSPVVADDQEQVNRIIESFDTENDMYNGSNFDPVVVNHNKSAENSVGTSKNIINVIETQHQQQRKKTKWLLPRSRDPKKSIGKMKQTLLSLASAVDDKLDISTLDGFNGGTMRRDETQPKEVLPDTDETYFVMGTTANNTTCYVPVEKDQIDVVDGGVKNTSPTNDISSTKENIETINAAQHVVPPVETFDPPVASTTNNFQEDKDHKQQQQQQSAKNMRTPTKVQTVVVDSFDVVPTTSPKYKYKRDALRKKTDRGKLPGQECTKCTKFYDQHRKDYSDTQIAKMLNKCSRHRDKYPIRCNTPPGLWSPTIGSQ